MNKEPTIDKIVVVNKRELLLAYFIKIEDDLIETYGKEFVKEIEYQVKLIYN